MINWKAIVLGFIVTIILAYLGNYIPYLDIPLAPIIGGIIAGLVVGGDYKNGLLTVDLQRVFLDLYTLLL